MNHEQPGIQVSYSTGRNYPKIHIPQNACDSHHHIFDPVRFPYKPTDIRNQPPATVDVYQQLQKKLGLTRNVIVTPSAYGTDNRCTLDALKQMGKNARAVVVLNEKEVTDEQLQQMHISGVRGVRYNITRGGVSDITEIRKMAIRIAPLGWHLVFWMSADITVEMFAFLNSLPCQIVFDHRGHLPADQGIQHPAFSLIVSMMKEGKAWVKLSALYHDSAFYKSDYHDTIEVGKAYIQAAPDRILWGTDWPHPSEFTAKRDFPDDAFLLDLLLVQAQTEENVKKILVDNPAILFGF